MVNLDVSSYVIKELEDIKARLKTVEYDKLSADIKAQNDTLDEVILMCVRGFLEWNNLCKKLTPVEWSWL